jgi:hypothetical protein
MRKGNNSVAERLPRVHLFPAASIRPADVVQRSIGCLLRSQKIAIRFFRQKLHFARIQVQFLHCERTEPADASSPIPAHARALKHQPVARIRSPSGSQIAGIAIGSHEKVSAFGLHHRDIRGEGVLKNRCSQSKAVRVQRNMPHAEIGGME